MEVSWSTGPPRSGGAADSGMQTACAEKHIPSAGEKKPPGGAPRRGQTISRRSACEGLRSAEAQPGAETDDAGADDLADEVRRGLLLPMVALEDVGLVEQVEAVHTQGQAEVAEGELLLDAGVDHVDVVEA